MAELALDDDERDAFVGHLGRVRVPELMRRPTRGAQRWRRGRSPDRSP